jgi:hypothetical protein
MSPGEEDRAKRRRALPILGLALGVWLLATEGPTAAAEYYSAYFLEKTAGDLRPVKNMIDQNTRKGGWLVFATHDVQDRPTPYGCTPKFFEDVVCYSIASGAQVLTVASALDLLRAGN